MTDYLREQCTGGFPVQISTDHNHEAKPIEYYLEVKSTPGANNTRFFMSGGQYERVCILIRGAAKNCTDHRTDGGHGTRTARWPYERVRHHARLTSDIAEREARYLCRSFEVQRRAVEFRGRSMVRQDTLVS